MAKPLPWPAIHRLEVAEDYPAAIDALEARLSADPHDAEAVTRLGFNLWFAVVENDRMQKALPVQGYAERFMELFSIYRDRLSDCTDFCWAFGLGMSMFWYYFPKATEGEGNRLLHRARTLDPFWARLLKPGADLTRLKDRGIFAKYYNVS